MKHILTAAAMSLLAACVHAGETVKDDHTDKPTMSGHHGPHIMTAKSAGDFDETLTRVQAAIDARGFKTFAVIDHAAGAASIDQPLRPTTLIIFGNPKGGTPLIQAAQTIAIDLPLKMLVYMDDSGAVTIAWPDVEHLVHEHGANGIDAQSSKIGAALAAIASEAAAPPPQ